MSERGLRGSSVLRVLMLAAMAGWVCTGCASMNQKCSYYEDGTLESYRLRSTVVGTGETEMISTDCTVAAYSTKDTGLSDNGEQALGTIAEGVVRGVIGNPL